MSVVIKLRTDALRWYQSFIIFFLLLITFSGKAQEVTISTDRPDQSDGVETVPFRKFQIEEGLTFAEKTVVNNLMLRYGLTNSTEVRLIADAGKENHLQGLQPLTLSVKQKIIRQHKVLPAITFVGDLSFGQLASNDYHSEQWPYSLKLAFENELSQKFTLSYNAGTSNEFRNLDLSLNLGYLPDEKWAVFIEYFSTLSEDEKEHNIDVGVLYLIHPLLQVDIAGGRSVFAKENRYFGTFGISYLFN